MASSNLDNNINFEIRQATVDDCEAIADLIKQLAVYEECPDEPKLSGADLKRDGFESDPPLYKCKVGEVINNDGSKKVVGYALYFNHYSTWKGHCVYLEDIYVALEYRKYGIGSQLFKEMAQEAAKTKSKRLLFNVLNWNTPSIEFYERRGAINLGDSEGWRPFRLEGENLARLANQ